MQCLYNQGIALIIAILPPRLDFMALKVFDLQCANGHVFEGWFASRDAFEDQKARGLLNCPVCGGHDIERKLSAARINLGKGAAQAQTGSAAAKSGETISAMSVPAGSEMAKMQARLLRHLRAAVRATENVGDRFAEEARRIHSGESEERAIRGTATRKERESLAEDGIEVVPIPDFLDDDRMQ
ncbi:hypothetical protein EV686_10232 [Paracandidimonas soli]|uniref:DUF1178 family protein n=2 Tax=Paracandidimonas soli TaxID=1917182 RepID=A0A4R3VCH7_9BURK|nr:hypothetical protein EV686_10232 [Paracandidimonas soli]